MEICQPTISQQYNFPLYTNSSHFDFVHDQRINGPKVSLETHSQESTLWRQIHHRHPQVVILGVDPQVLSSGLIRRLSTIANRPIIVSLLETVDDQMLGDCYAQGSDRVLAIPNCSADIFHALLHTLVRKEINYSPYRISSKIRTINFADNEVRLTKKTFAVAKYLFVNHGKLISKSRILRELWGLDSAHCLTRRVDVQVSQVRKLLALDGSFGWEIRTNANSELGVFHNPDVC